MTIDNPLLSIGIVATQAVHTACARAEQTVWATRNGTYSHTDPGVGVRKVLNELRSRTIENFNQQFKSFPILTAKCHQRSDEHSPLRAVFVYQLSPWYHFEHGLTLCVDFNAFLKAA